MNDDDTFSIDILHNTNFYAAIYNTQGKSYGVLNNRDGISRLKFDYKTYFDPCEAPIPANASIFPNDLDELQKIEYNKVKDAKGKSEADKEYNKYKGYVHENTQNRGYHVFYNACSGLAKLCLINRPYLESVNKVAFDRVNE